MWSCRLAGTRASAVQPASAIDANRCVAVSQSTRLCSMSTFSQAKPTRAKNRAAVMLPSDSHVPTAGCPAFRARFTGFARMVLVLSSGGLLFVMPPGRGDAATWLPGPPVTGHGRLVVVGRRQDQVVVVIMRVLVFFGTAATGRFRPLREVAHSRSCVTKHQECKLPSLGHPSSRSLYARCRCAKTVSLVNACGPGHN